MPHGNPTIEQNPMIFEIRNYHFDPSRFEEYKQWAEERAVPYLKANLDILGFWVSTNISPEVNGAPQDELGSANVTWIIRWRDTEERDERFRKVLSSPEWQAIFEHVPGGPASYLRTESKLATELP